MSLINDGPKRTPENTPASGAMASENKSLEVSPPPLQPRGTTTVRLKRAESSGAQPSPSVPPVLLTTETVAPFESPVSVPSPEPVVTEASSKRGVRVGLLVVLFVLGGLVAFFRLRPDPASKKSEKESKGNAVKEMVFTPIQRTRDAAKKVKENKVVGVPGAKTVGIVPPKSSAVKVKTVPSSSGPLTGFRVQGVTVQGEIREAMINDQTVRVGEEVDGAKVVEILPDEVKLLVNGQEFVIKLF